MAPRLVQTGQQVRIVDDSDQVVAAFSRDPTGDASAVVVAKTADETVTASTVLQNDDELLFPIGASVTEIWWVEFFLMINAPNVTMDFKCAFVVPAGASMLWGMLGNGAANVQSFGPTNTSAQTAIGLQSASTPFTAGTPAGGTIGLSIGGFVFGGGTAGQTVLQWAQGTSDAGNLVVKRGSFLRTIKLTA